MISILPYEIRKIFLEIYIVWEIFINLGHMTKYLGLRNFKINKIKNIYKNNNFTKISINLAYSSKAYDLTRGP